jgi:hypothetical protein
MCTSPVIDAIYSRACRNFHFNLTYILWTVFLLIAVMFFLEVKGQLHASVALPPGKELLVPIGYEAGWGTRAGLDAVE